MSDVIHRELKLADAPTRLATHWNNRLMSWSQVKAKLKDARPSPFSVAEYQAMSKDRQADAKDVGGFVGGHLAEGKRRSGHVLARSILTLDIDFPPEDFLENLEGYLGGIGGVLYSTFSHAPGHERYRLVLPLTRDVGPDAYEAVARRIAADVGIDIFDDTTFEPHRLMYWPGRPIDAQFVYRELRGDWIDPDAVLARYDSWQDMSTWPTSSRQTKRLEHAAQRQADPLTKPGIVGAFCRTYDIDAAIETFLPTVYVAGGSPDRYTYAAGESSNGVVVYGGQFAYSHHGTDPAGGQTLNAFDLVRVHRFGADDDGAKEGTPSNKLPSFTAMVALATSDPAVKLTAAKEQAEQAAIDFGDVVAGGDASGADVPDADNRTLALALERNGKNEVVDSMNNHLAILKHAGGLQDIAYNTFASEVAVRPGGTLPWRRVTDTWSDTDLAQLKAYVSANWNIYSPGKTKDALTAVAATRPFHPVRQYLDALPKWDGVPRIDTLLVDYLGAADNSYVRAVTRKTLVAAIARVRRPGVKFDTVLILNGPQGAGKSTIFAKLGGAWFSDALTLTDMKDKTGAEKLQGYWILELGELAGMRKMEVEVVKGFISRTDDKFRPAYGSVVESHPRQCIIVGSTNAQDGFLRDITGNRRFWPVAVTGVGAKRAWDISGKEIDQIWAEAVYRYERKEPLHLTGDVAQQAAHAQDDAIEADDRVGLVEAYLNRLLPEGWEDMSVVDRRIWLEGRSASSEFGGKVEGTVRRTAVSKVEIWAECFGREPSDLTTKDSYAISSIMKQVGEWELGAGAEGRGYVHPYGRQRLFLRDENPPF